MRRNPVRILALVFGVATFAALVFVLFPSSVVPQRSTASLAFLPIMLFSAVGLAIGAGIGKVIKYVGERRGRMHNGEQESTVVWRTESRLLIIITFLVIISSSYIVVSVLNSPRRIEYEQANVFGVKFDDGIVQKIELVSSNLAAHEDLLECGTFYTGDPHSERETSFSWSDDMVKLSFIPSGDYLIENLSTDQTIRSDLKYYDYIISVSLFPYDKAGRSYLFVLTNLRATSNRSLLTVYEKTDNTETAGKIVYEELLENRGKLILGYGRLNSGGDVITVSSYQINKVPSPSYDLCELGAEDVSIQLLQYGYQI